MTTGTYPFVRHDAQLAFALEDDHGDENTTEADFRSFGKIVEAGEMPDPEIDWQENRSIDASGRELSGKEPGQNVYDGGSLTVIPVDEFPFEFLLGEQVGATTTGEIHVSAAPLPMTATVQATYFGHGEDDDFVRTFVGNAPQSGTIQVTNEDELAIDFDFQAQGVSTGATPFSIDAPDENPWLFLDAESALTIHGTTYARVVDFSWELTNELDPRYYIQPTNPEDPFEIHYGNAAHAITAEIVPVDDSLFEDLLGRDDSGGASIAFERPDGAKLDFQFQNVGIESAPHDYPDEGAPEVTVALIPDSGHIAYTAPA